jgi:hypothetical protein
MDYETGCKSYRATLRALLIKHFTDLVLDQNGKLPPDCHPTVSNLCPGCSQACSVASAHCRSPLDHIGCPVIGVAK